MLQSIIHGWAKDQGWWTDLETGETKDRNTGELMMLMVTELAEGFEGFRKNMPDEHLPQFSSLEVELADTMIRILDFAGGKNLNLAAALVAKMQYNCQRLDHTIEHRKGKFGKKV
jgi:NTP pyrophosphatase (non-canonical NTP hydrolase)